MLLSANQCALNNLNVCANGSASQFFISMFLQLYIQQPSQPDNTASSVSPLSQALGQHWLCLHGAYGLVDTTHILCPPLFPMTY